MAHVVIMPKLGNTVESCIIVKWNVSEGQEVGADSVLCEIETDKATMDVPAGVSGTLLKRLRAEGDDVPVLEPIAIIGAAGESIEGLTGQVPQQAPQPEAAVLKDEGARPSAASGREGGAAAAATAATAATMAVAAAPSVAVAASMPTATDASRGASPRARALANGEGLALSSIAEGTGPGGRILERDVRAALDAAPQMTAAARSIVTLNELYKSGKTIGSGLGGRVTLSDLADMEAAKAAKPASEADVHVAATQAAGGARVEAGAQAAAPAAAPQGATETAYPGPFTDTPIKSIRKIIADRMMHSLQSSAQLTLSTSAPAEKMLAVRARFKNSDPSLGLSGITIGDLVAYAVLRVLSRHPKLNSHSMEGLFRSYSHVHLGFAVDTPRGLMVPVLRNADTLSLRQMSGESKKLAKACIEGGINPDLLTGSTFTVTNLGSFGIESFTPILNEPEVGILGVCSIVPRPVAESGGATSGTSGAVAAGQVGGVSGTAPAYEMRIGLSLTIDHRIVDGADGARFLKDLTEYIANIDVALLAGL